MFLIAMSVPCKPERPISKRQLMFTGQVAAPYTYIPAIKQPTLHYLTRSVRRRAATLTRFPDRSYKKECQEKTSPSAGRRSFFLGIQPNRLNVHSESGLPQVLRPRLVSACEAENQLLCPVVPLRCCDGAIGLQRRPTPQGSPQGARNASRDDWHDAPRVNFFMNKFRKLGFIKYNGGLQINTSLLSVVLHE